MFSKKIWVLVLVCGLLAAGFYLWRIQESKARAARVEEEILRGLDREEIALLISSDKNAHASVTGSAEAGRQFLKGMREYLALATQARREGLHEDPNFIRNLAYKKKILLADLYREKLSADQGLPYAIPDEEAAAVWQFPENEKAFAGDMEALRAIQLQLLRQRGQPESLAPGLAGGALEKARSNWARNTILAAKAEADSEFMARPEIPLRMRVLEAGILSTDLLRNHYPDEIKVTEKDRADYLSRHPELDVNVKKTLAASLLERVKNGEDIAKLAADHSEDRPTRSRGGLYEDVAPDMVWSQVEQAALAANPGELVPTLIESNTGYHIVRLESKKQETAADGNVRTKFAFRHILIQKNFEDPNHTLPDVPAPFLSPAEIANAAVEKEKRDKFVERIVSAVRIDLPDEISIS